MIYRSCKIRVPNLSLICQTMLHLPMLSKHSDGLPYLKSALYIDTLPLLSTSTDLWITILMLWEAKTSIVITLDWEGTISVFHSLKGIIFYGKRRLFYQCTKEWNILDTSFKEINSLLLFKQNIKSCIF